MRKTIKDKVKEIETKAVEYDLLIGDLEKSLARFGDRGSVLQQEGQLSDLITMMQYVITLMTDDKVA